MSTQTTYSDGPGTVISKWINHIQTELSEENKRTRFPSIALATFSSQFDSHIICIRISPDGNAVLLHTSADA